MKASDLRIGNLVEKSLKSGNGRNVISEIGYADIQRIYEDTGSFNYEPIPISEEWLLKFRYNRLSAIFFYNELYRVEKSINNNKWFFRFRVSESLSYEIAKIKYVHQLQNIIYALTGQELTLNEIK